MFFIIITENLKNTSSLSEIIYLKLEAVFFSAVFSNFWIDILHQSVPLHQHVCEGGTCENANNL